MATLFISDLHLSAERPETIRLFLDFLANEARHAEALYILGDLFEVWLGDDLVMPEYRPVISALREFTENGTLVFVMHGNRDFLLGSQFEEESGCRLIDDPHLLDLNGTPTLLMHGDLLCTDDEPYQAMRRQLREPRWIAAFLNKSPQERIDFARDLRERSRRETGAKAETIMDVNKDTVMDFIQKYHAGQLIHGHTHRPADHSHEVDGQTVHRYVLPEWHGKGGLIRCDEQGCRAETIG